MVPTPRASSRGHWLWCWCGPLECWLHSRWVIGWKAYHAWSYRGNIIDLFSFIHHHILTSSRDASSRLFSVAGCQLFLLSHVSCYIINYVFHLFAYVTALADQESEHFSSLLERWSNDVAEALLLLCMRRISLCILMLILSLNASLGLRLGCYGCCIGGATTQDI
jgi:hypothetical protein